MTNPLNRFVIWLFAWSFVLCAASRWRIAGVGIGEVSLSLASGLTLLRTRFALQSPPELRIWLQFAGLSGIALLTGTLWALAEGIWEPTGFTHDALALSFCFVALDLLLPFLAEDPQRHHFVKHWLWASLTLVAANLLLYEFYGELLGEGKIWINRFSGLSANPNQLALYVCSMPFWLLARPHLLPRWVTVLGVIGSLYLGWLTGSDALMLGWFAGFGWLAAHEIMNRQWRTNPTQNTYAKTLLMSLYSLLLVSGLVLFWASATDIYAIGGQGDLRVLRWQNGLQILTHSPLFGLGPGAFSGDRGPFEGQEAHNLYIDWMASGGILAGLALIWFQRRVWFSLRNRHAPALTAGFLCLLVFGLFHYMARHPVFWLVHLLCLTHTVQSAPQAIGNFPK